MNGNSENIKSNNQKKIWEFPWGYGESFLVSFELLLAGIAIEAVTGARGISFPAFPGNLLLAGIFTGLLVFIYTTGYKKPLIRWLSSVPAAISAISLLSLLVLLLGFIPQGSSSNRFLIVTGLSHVKSSWPFLLSQIYLLVTLGFVIMRRSRQLTRKNIGFLLNHLGLWIIVVAAGLGSADLKQYNMNLFESKGFDNLATDKHNIYHKLPFSVKLLDFNIDMYPPKLAIIDTRTGMPVEGEGNNLIMIEENKHNYEVMDYHVEIKKYHHLAAFHDSLYTPSEKEGSVPAMYVTVTSPAGTTREGWLGSASSKYNPSYIILGNHDVLYLTMPESKKYSSEVIVQTENTKDTITIEVNKPHKVLGWKLYQLSYDENKGRWSELSVLQAVKDPWLPVVYLGIFMLLGGAVYLFWIGKDIKEEQNKTN
ncbi:MAG: cytochrome c biogenesis protein ResB [Bacteroidales bacterium]